MVKDSHLQHTGHQVEPEGGPDNPGKQKEGSPGLIGEAPETLFQIAINAGKVQPVVKGKQHLDNENIAQQVAQDHLHVGKLAVDYPPGYGYEGNSRERGTDHAKGHNKPG